MHKIFIKIFIKKLYLLKIKINEPPRTNEDFSNGDGVFSRRSITKHRIFSDTRHEGGEREKNNTVETSCIARFKLYIRVISYGNSENGKGHQE